MNEFEMPIYPNIKRTLNICKAKVRILELKLNTSVRIAVFLFNENDLLVDTTQLLIEGKEYDDWTNDTDFIKLIKQKIQENNKNS